MHFNAARDRYEILDVMPPDEHQRNVNNSAVTNAVAQLALQLPSALHVSSPGRAAQWLRVAENIYVPFDAEHNYHPEFDGYALGSEKVFFFKYFI